MESVNITGVKLEIEDSVLGSYSFCIEKCSFEGSREPGVRIWKDEDFIEIPVDVFDEMVKALQLLPDFEEYLNGRQWPSAKP